MFYLSSEWSESRIRELVKEELMAILSTEPILATPDVRTINLDVSSIPKKSYQEESFAVPDLLLTDHVNLIKPTPDANVSVISARVSAVDELAVKFLNTANSPSDPAAQDFLLLVSRGT